MSDESIGKPTQGRSVRHTNKIGFILINKSEHSISVRELYELYLLNFNPTVSQTMDNNFDFGIINCYEYELIKPDYNLRPFLRDLHYHVLMINQKVSLTPQGALFFKHLQGKDARDFENIEFVTSNQAEYYRNYLKLNPLTEPKIFSTEFHRGDSLTLEVLMELEDLQEETTVEALAIYWKLKVKASKKQKTLEDTLRSYLKRLKDIRAVFIYPKSKPYVYGLTEFGREIAEISKNKREANKDVFGEIEKWL